MNKIKIIFLSIISLFMSSCNLLILMLTLTSCQIAGNYEAINPRNRAILNSLIYSYENEHLNGKVASILRTQYVGEIENGKVVKTTDNRYPVYLSKYDKSGKKIKTTAFWDEKDVLVSKQFYTYNDDRLTETKIIYYDVKGKRRAGAPYGKYTYADDKVTEYWYKDKEILTKKEEMIFDSLGRKETAVQETFAPANKRKIKMTYFYNNKKLLERRNSEWTLVDSTANYDTTYDFDEYGNITEQQRVNLEGNIEISKSSMEYEYDDQDNWIRRVWFTGSETIFIFEREIEYY